MLFGHYRGTVACQGLHWVNPFSERRRISVRVRNFETAKLKVNDNDGNPIEIAAVVVWKVTDTAEALFEVDDYENFVHVQAESALRNLATSHPYDTHVEDEIALRANPAEIADQLRPEIQDRLDKAGVEVIEARISHLAYAPEIANAMLRRQQAKAVIAARTRIVEGAVGMVEMALEQLSAKKVVDARRGAEGPDGEQPAGRPVLGARDAAGGQRRDALLVAATARSDAGVPAGAEGHHGGAEAVPAAPRSRDVRGPPAVGRGRPPVDERPGGVPAPARAAGRATSAGSGGGKAGSSLPERDVR